MSRSAQPGMNVRAATFVSQNPESTSSDMDGASHEFIPRGNPFALFTLENMLHAELVALVDALEDERVAHIATKFELRRERELRKKTEIKVQLALQNNASLSGANNILKSMVQHSLKMAEGCAAVTEAQESHEWCKDNQPQNQTHDTDINGPILYDTLEHQKTLYELNGRPVKTHRKTLPKGAKADLDEIDQGSFGVYDLSVLQMPHMAGQKLVHHFLDDATVARAEEVPRTPEKVIASDKLIDFSPEVADDFCEVRSGRVNPDQKQRFEKVDAAIEHIRGRREIEIRGNTSQRNLCPESISHLQKNTTHFISHQNPPPLNLVHSPSVPNSLEMGLVFSCLRPLGILFRRVKTQSTVINDDRRDLVPSSTNENEITATTAEIGVGDNDQNLAPDSVDGNKINATPEIGVTSIDTSGTNRDLTLNPVSLNGTAAGTSGMGAGENNRNLTLNEGNLNGAIPVPFVLRIFGDENLTLPAQPLIHPQNASTGAISSISADIAGVSIGSDVLPIATSSNITSTPIPVPGAQQRESDIHEVSTSGTTSPGLGERRIAAGSALHPVRTFGGRMLMDGASTISDLTPSVSVQDLVTSTSAANPTTASAVHLSPHDPRVLQNPSASSRMTIMSADVVAPATASRRVRIPSRIPRPFGPVLYWNITRETPVFDSGDQFRRARFLNEIRRDSVFWQHPVRYMPGFATPNLYRTVMMDFIPLHISVRQVLEKVRGGALESIQLLPKINKANDFQTARIVFHQELDAQNICFKSQNDGIYLGNQQVRVWQVQTATYPKNQELQELYDCQFSRILQVRSRDTTILAMVPDKLEREIKLGIVLNIEWSATDEEVCVIEFGSMKAAARAMGKLQENRIFEDVSYACVDDYCGEQY